MINKDVVKRKILVLAYVISPTRGSEYSVAWNYVKHMSVDNELVVLYGASAEHMGDTNEMENYALRNVKFVPIKPNRIAYTLNWFNHHNIFVYTFYCAYAIWQKLAYQKARKLIASESFDLIHYVGPIGYREPGYLWKLNLPYIWGPIGGVGNINPKLIESLNFSGKIKLGFRAMLNSIQLRFSRRVAKALKRADVLLTATTENQDVFKRIHGVDSHYIPENAIDKLYPLNMEKFDNISSVNLIFVGTIESRKSLKTALQALTKVRNKSSVKLHVVGEGPLKANLQEFCTANNLAENVIWHGAVKRDEVFKLMNDAHLHIITSVSEGNPTTIWEAMSVGLPTLSLKHCGMRDTITPESGFLIDINSYEQIVGDIANVIDECVENPSLLKEKADGVLTTRKKYLWDNRVKFIEECYDEAIRKFEQKKQR